MKQNKWSRSYKKELKDQKLKSKKFNEKFKIAEDFIVEVETINMKKDLWKRDLFIAVVVGIFLGVLISNLK